jgi:hypothetical protein
VEPVIAVSKRAGPRRAGTHLELVHRVPVLVQTHVIDHHGNDILSTHNASRERVRRIDEVDSACRIASGTALTRTEEDAVQERAKSKVVATGNTSQR